MRGVFEFECQGRASSGPDPFFCVLIYGFLKTLDEHPGVNPNQLDCVELQLDGVPRQGAGESGEAHEPGPGARRATHRAQRIQWGDPTPKSSRRAYLDWPKNRPHNCLCADVCNSTQPVWAVLGFCFIAERGASQDHSAAFLLESARIGARRPPRPWGSGGDPTTVECSARCGRGKLSAAGTRRREERYYALQRVPNANSFVCGNVGDILWKFSGAAERMPRMPEGEPQDLVRLSRARSAAPGFSIILELENRVTLCRKNHREGAGGERVRCR